MTDAMELCVGAIVVAPKSHSRFLCTSVLQSEFSASSGFSDKNLKHQRCVRRHRVCTDGRTEQMLIRWIIGFQHSVPVAVWVEEAEASLPFSKSRAPSGLDSLFPSGAYKLLLQILCTDDRHSPWQGDWSSKANGLPIVEPEGRREGGEGGMMSGLDWVD